MAEAFIRTSSVRPILKQLGTDEPAWKDKRLDKASHFALQGILNEVKKIHNDVDVNLIAVDSNLNAKKGAAVTAALSILDGADGTTDLLERGLHGQIVQTFSTGVSARSRDDSDKVASSITRFMKSIESPITSKIKAVHVSSMRDFADSFADEISQLYDAFHL